jgi:uncharacterized protein
MPIDINPVVPQGRQLVQSYGDGRFKISTVEYTGSVFVFPEETLSWYIKSVEDISIEALAPITAVADDYDIILIGAGSHFGRIPFELRKALKQEFELVLEWMDTGAACRTFNVLIGEERRVAAALIAVQ